MSASTTVPTPPPTPPTTFPVVPVRIPLTTGVTLPVVTTGREDGVPVLLLHGLSDSGPSWEPVLAHLPAHVRAIVPTQRGHGDADKPRAGYTPDDMAADAVALLDALGVERAVVVGHSMGTVVAQRLAATHPERIRALVLVGAFAPLDAHPMVAELDQLFGALVDPVDPGFISDFQDSTIAQPLDPAFLAMVKAESAKVPARVWQQAWVGIRDADLATALARIDAPVHLVWGARDDTTDRSMQDAILAARPDATLTVHEDAGHALHWEEPARFAAELVEVVAGLPTEDAGAPSLDERMFEAALGTLELFGVLLGTRLGLYERLADVGPTTVSALADATGVDVRYLQEWCEQQAVAGFLGVDDPSAPADRRRFHLPAAHRGALVDGQDPAHVAPFAEMVVGIAAVIDEVVDAYRTGAGVPYARYGAAFRHGQGAINRPAFVHDLPSWLAAAGVDLSRPGTRVADVGSGLGWSTIALAEAFPSAEVVGYDSDPASVAEASGLAARQGSRARFVVADGAAVALDGPFDAVVVLEALHDLADPVGVLRACRSALADGGVVVVADENVAEAFTAPGDELERMMYGWSISHCLPACRAEHPSAALGTVLRPDTLRALASEAGFTTVEVVDVDAGFFRVYRLAG